jgi:RNA-binding protein 5/10
VAFARDAGRSGAISALSSAATEAIRAAQFQAQYDTSGAHTSLESSGWAPKEFTEGEGGAKEGEGQDATAAALGYAYDANSGYYYDAKSGFYYDAKTGLFYDGNNQVIIIIIIIIIIIS